MTLQDTLNAAKLGNAEMIKREAELRGNQIADERLKSAQIEDQIAQSREEETMMREDEARRLGQEEGALSIIETVAPGSASGPLGMAPQTAESIGQRGAVNEQVMNEDAMAVIAQIEQAQAEGAPQEVIKQMVDSVPPELHGIIRQIKEQQAAEAGSQPVAPQGAEMGGIPQEEGNALTNHAKNLALSVQ